MLSRLKTGFSRPSSKAFHVSEPTKIGLLLPRFWLVLLLLAPPFFIICSNYFESLERSGRVGAIIADTMFPAILVSYLVLIGVLKQRRI